MQRPDPPPPPSLGDVLDWSDARSVVPRERRTRPSVRRSFPEALAWAMFSAGGFVAAIFLPVHVAILGIAYAAGWLPHDALTFHRIHHLADNPLVKLYLLAVIALPLFHWAHRFRFAIHHQFGIGMRKLAAAGCYGSAVAGAGLAVWALLRI